VTVLLIAGAIATGKTAAADGLALRLDAELMRVRNALHDVLGIDVRDRQALQRRGADLDTRTSGRWLRDYIGERHDTSRDLVVDALRTRRQTLPILEALVDSRLVFLEAHEETRRARYAQAAASDPLKASVDFETAMHHPTETEVHNLRPLSHVVVATDDLTVVGVVDEVMRQLDLD
jgi:hypothetical protein